jgi:hypothetical protein
MPRKTPEVASTKKNNLVRDDDGQFVRGNAGGPGNPFARQVAALRKLLLDTVAPDKLQKLVESLIERAIGGDNAAAKLVLQYTLGKPAATVEPDRVHVDEFRLREESAIPAATWIPVLNELPAELINIIGDRIGPALHQDRKEAFLDSKKTFDDTPAGRRAKRKANKRFFRAMNTSASPSPNGSFGPNRAG